jgi:hypothetical protein
MVCGGAAKSRWGRPLRLTYRLTSGDDLRSSSQAQDCADRLALDCVLACPSIAEWKSLPEIRCHRQQGLYGRFDLAIDVLTTG